ncbi:ATP-grasp domain-containing protein [Aphanothece sacrum]|uniref:Succinyl-CoA ligase n=1 Tax=Aphanothece sacrum FPU1 TaxID=1920663 RepID=A0A401IDZ6_APHSA|nr:ATP-grasp domain-containing protein [Aphanothece sacrum]GBF79454.1 succinyl-CoA ligase [Aphanothece sacrum FPU1]GBF85996.1 succinyl-CoA ligase [Aphanothece sacrum FPU3]
MDLLEYQAKELFHQVGIPILPSQPIANLSELKHLQIPYPVVLKSQVHSGGRGRAGGIRFVQNTIDAVAAAQAIFSLPILGEYPQVILAEARYDAQSEFFLCVVLDYHLQRPVLLGSAKGGIDVDTLLNHMEQVVLDQEFSPFYARRLATKMGLSGSLINVVSVIVEKMYQLFVEKDLDLIEINPLAVSPGGEVMALDGKITVNNTALCRHLDLLSLITSRKDTEATALNPIKYGGNYPLPSKKPSLIGTQSGNIGIIGNSWGLTLATWDLLVQQKGKPACAFILEEKGTTKSLSQQLQTALGQMIGNPNLRVILINILGSPETSEAMAEVIANYGISNSGVSSPLLKSRSEDRLPRATAANDASRKRGQPDTEGQPKKVQSLELVVRLVGRNLTSFQEILPVFPLHWLDNLDSAIAKTIGITTAKP